MALRVEIQNPTVDLYTELEHKYSMECFCSNASILHGQFIELVPIYHQVCSSDFVTQRWIDHLFDLRKTPFYFAADFRSTASQQFQVLAALCRFSAQGIKYGLDSFFGTELISNKIMSKAFFLAEIQAHIDAFKINTIDAFDYKLMFIREIIAGNALLPSTETILNFILRYSDNGPWAGWSIQTPINGFFDPDGYFCSCKNMPRCYGKAGFFGDNLYIRNNGFDSYAYLHIIDGWYIGCRPIDSLLLSTLKTFYNQTMINRFLQFFNNVSSNFTCLNANDKTIFDPNTTTLETIVKRSFIEKWIQQINYSLYFNYCAPKLCSYTINKPFNIYYIISVIIGVYGGLSIALRVLIPIIIKSIIRQNEETSSENLSFGRVNRLIRSWFQKLIPALRKLNLFRSAIRVEPSDIYKQRWSTRLYIILFLLSFIIVTMYTAMTEQPTRIDLTNPSLDKVLDLQQQTSLSSLQCPCSQLSSSFKYFIELVPTYHEICFSDFVSDLWIYFFSFVDIYRINDFRRSGPIFKLVQSFCKLANTTVNNALNIFYETQLVSLNLITFDRFISQMNSDGRNFQLVTPNRFSYLLELMSQTIRANKFIYGSYTNYLMSVQNNTGHLMVEMKPVNMWFNNDGSPCSLLSNRDCELQFIVDAVDMYGNSTEIRIPGFYMSSFFTESLLISELQCLYNQSCVDYISKLVTNEFNFTVLSQTSRFPNNVTFSFLSNDLFIESWSQKLNYTAYFEQCQPHSCSYIISQRPTFILLIATVIGLSASISVVLQFVSPCIIAFILRCYRQTQQRSSSEVIQQEGKYFLRNISVMNRSLFKKYRHLTT
jgi:hypothetical protein